MRARLLASLPLVCASVAWSSSQVAQSLGERARDADRVVLGQVLDVQVHVPDGDPRRMTTVTTVLVREDYKGAGAGRIEVVQLGGVSGLWSSRVAGDATFGAGETAVLFLRCRDPAAPQRCGLVGLADGKLPVTVRSEGQRVRALRVDRSLESVVDEIRRALPQARPLRRGRP
jgi:hypothetical protein